jgi:acyl-lipid omega-6 desaturase (Delta-12 desaturase)
MTDMAEAGSIRADTEVWCKRDDRIAMASYLGTFAFYFATLALALFWSPHFAITALLVILNGLSGVRLYVIQHDLGHNSLFTKRGWNEIAGVLSSTFTLTPFHHMQYNHNRHHSYIGNLEARETGEVNTMTVREWQAAGVWKRLYYRLYRNPLLMLPIGGLWTYGLRYRWPKNAVKVGLGRLVAHNLAILLWLAAIWYLAGERGLVVYFWTVFTAGVVGVFSVYLQHNFEYTYWDRRPDYDLREAALTGSSCVDLGWWYDLATCNIHYHDLHHFNPRIPSYRLRQCHRALRGKYNLPVVRWGGALKAFTLKLWDEEQEKLVPFPKSSPQVVVPA